MKIGYIRKTRRPADDKIIFSYVEANGTRRIGVRSDTVKVPFLYTTPYEEIKSNTEMITSNLNLMLVGEPFFTDSELKNVRKNGVRGQMPANTKNTIRSGIKEMTRNDHI